MDCSLNSNNYQPQSHSHFDLQSLLDRFQTIPEQEQIEPNGRGNMRCVVQQHLERIAERIRVHDEPHLACIERLTTQAVIAAESVGGTDHLEEYQEMALQVMEVERTMLLKDRQESKHHQEDAEKQGMEVEEEEEDVLDINLD